MNSKRKLTKHARCATPSELAPLMEEEPPPVPPKDPAYTTSRMELNSPPTAPASSSKRKREAHDETLYTANDRQFGAVDPDAHTPKRSRSVVRQSDASASEDVTPARSRSIRRKKGSRNLSTLSLRHAAEQQEAGDAQARESKFQEGSLNDKPSEKPPSVFTRMVRTDSGNILQVDELMQDYHEGADIPRDSHAEAAKRDDGHGFFQFGRHLASNFHPVTLWNKIWNDTKEELTQRNIEEAERKARLKEEAEARYAQMKKSGQFGLQPVGKAADGGRGSVYGLETPLDSAVEIDGPHKLTKHTREVSETSGVDSSEHGTAGRFGSEFPESASKQNKGLMGRLHFRKPSLSNMRGELKKVKSEMSLGGSRLNREPSSSLSPVKRDFSTSTLRKSESKFDLKRQRKLSKRVSDLESKLVKAREELDEALVEASPMPKLNNKYERFTPSGTVRRPKFMPGNLPSLPSERILMAEQMGAEARDEPDSRSAVNLTEVLEDDMSDGTVKVSREKRQYPTRAISMFDLKHNNENVEDQRSSDIDRSTDNLKSSEPQHPSTEATENMDPNSIAKPTAEEVIETPKLNTYPSLDEKLKALDANVKLARKPPKPKKRKSGVDEDDKPFKPGKESDDDAEWEEANETPRKKRKSTGGKNDNSPQNKRSSGGKQNKKTSPQGKKGKKTTKGDDVLSASPEANQTKDGAKASEIDHTDAVGEEFSADETADDEAQRTSFDSQDNSVDNTLDVVYEEEEETTKVPVNDEPSKPTAKATPARHARSSLRARSGSPHKRNSSIPQGPEEQMLTRSAEAARQHPGRSPSRSVSPPPAPGYTKTTTVVDKTVSVKPGEGDVPKLPKGAKGSFESLDTLEKKSTAVEVLRGGKSDENFEWPDDVF